MNPLLVSSYFDIGRGSWSSLSRSQERYFDYYRHYLAKLPCPRYLLANAETQEKVAGTVDFPDVVEFDQLWSHRFLEPTRQVMLSKSFRKLFSEEDDRNHIEHRSPEYNVMMMAKWDALERAAALTENRFSHYVWLDFGLGHGPGGYLPPPIGFSPIERDRIVLSAQYLRRPSPITEKELRYRVRRFKEQIAGSMMVIPVDLLPTYVFLARNNYQKLLDMNLTTDDQVICDMCVAERPDLFYLSYAPRGLAKFSHIHNILNGLDAKQPRTWRIPIYDKLTRKTAEKRARAAIGL